MPSLIFIRSVNPEFDSRLNKFLSVLIPNDIDHEILWWNRLDEKSSKKNKMSEFKWRGKLGARWKNFLGLFFWNFYIFFWLTKNSKKIAVIHAIDFDCIFPAFVFSKIFRKKLIFDVYDKYTDAKSIKGTAKVIVDKLENFFIKYSDASILVDECRFKQHQLDKKDNIFVIENVPELLEYRKNINTSKNENGLVLGYFGALEPRHRGLEDLVNVVLKNSNLTLIIAGYGELSNFLEKISADYPDRIKFYGKLSSIDGFSLVSCCDIYIGMYYKTNANHYWAAPNKYFEHLMLGIPLLTTNGTPPGDKVVKFKTGWAINEGESNLENFFSQVTRNEINDYATNASSLWEENFSLYFSNYYRGLYVDVVKKLISN